MWILSVSRNVVVVLSSMILAYIWGNPPFKLTGSVPPGLPALHPPQFLLPNKRNDTSYGSGQRIDGNQEILALSVIKIVGGFFSAQPTSGSFSRSAVNEASGVKSQFSGFFTGKMSTHLHLIEPGQ
jgi:sodium-independent sulfate anion transporter 11